MIVSGTIFEAKALITVICIVKALISTRGGIPGGFKLCYQSPPLKNIKRSQFQGGKKKTQGFPLVCFLCVSFRDGGVCVSDLKAKHFPLG